MGYRIFIKKRESANALDVVNIVRPMTSRVLIKGPIVWQFPEKDLMNKLKLKFTKNT